MIELTVCRGASPLVLLVGLGLAAATPVAAQGTAAQREACAADAIKLCSDTIPDEGKTAACMASHRSELSPRCGAEFDAATDAPPATQQAERPPEAAPPAAPDAAPPPHPHRYVERPRDDDAAEAPPSAEAAPPPPRNYRPHYSRRDSRDIREAKRGLAQACAFLDANTCAFTDRMIDLAR